MTVSIKLAANVIPCTLAVAQGRTARWLPQRDGIIIQRFRGHNPKSQHPAQAHSRRR